MTQLEALLAERNANWQNPAWYAIVGDCYEEHGNQSKADEYHRLAIALNTGPRFQHRMKRWQNWILVLMEDRSGAYHFTNYHHTFVDFVVRAKEEHLCVVDWDFALQQVKNGFWVRC